MNAPNFRQATIEEKGNGLIRIKGNSQNLNVVLYILIAFGIFGGFFIGFVSPDASQTQYDRIEIGLVTFVFFTAFAFFVRFIFLPPIFWLFRGKNFYKLWWNDFTFDGKTVISGKFSIEVSEIAFIEPFVKKFSSDTDDWYYAQIMNHRGIEIGRVMVVSEDLSMMVEYLSDLFGVSYDENIMEKFWSNN